ncbi:MAG: nuclear transport factor 2 family protein [Lachnospiraceae bacterium]|nr:nuclear transport factor 2 family protein [Lachnospiraceae bacterium]
MFDLENGIAELETFTQKLSDYDAVLNRFYRYIHYYGLMHISGVMEQFSKKEDVSLEIGEEGMYTGYETIKEYFGFLPKLAAKPGTMIYHYVDTPVVQIAKDGQTAKITCLAPGLDAAAKALVQNWVYGKYYVDLIREDGEWKLWHVQWFRTFECAMTEGWLKEQTAHDRDVKQPALADVYSGGPKAEAGSYPDDWKYPKHFDPDAVNYLLPEPPKAYDTWMGKTAMENTRTY